MTDRSQLKHHAGLVDRMAALQGIDLQEEAVQGTLRVDDIADMVLRCAGCSNPEHCQSWMREHVEGADKSPGYCQNRELFAMLRSGRGI